MDHPPIQWAPRVQPHLIRRLYEADAIGLADQGLVDEVGFALLLRCETIQRVTERRCPECGQRLEGAFAEGPRDRRVECPDCGWSSTWDAYHRSYKGHRIHGGRAYQDFLRFLREFPRCRAVSDKMLAIDRLIHAVHHTEGGNASPAASNLIYEKKAGWARTFLDQLAYGDQTGTPREGIREDYRARIAKGMAWADEHRRRLEADGRADDAEVHAAAHTERI